MKILAIIIIIVSESYCASKGDARCYEKATKIFEDFCEKPTNDKSDRAFGDRIGIAVEFNKLYHAFEKNNGNTCTHLNVMTRMIQKYWYDDSNFVTEEDVD
jgi:hypothetical protein